MLVILEILLDTITMIPVLLAFSILAKQRITAWEAIIFIIMTNIIINIVFYITDFNMFSSLAGLFCLFVLANVKLKSFYLSIIFSSLCMMLTMLGNNVGTFIMILLTGYSIEYLYNHPIFNITIGLITLPITLLLAKFIGKFFDSKMDIFSVELKEKFAKYLTFGVLFSIFAYYCNVFLIGKEEFESITTMINIVILVIQIGFFIVTVYTFTKAIQNAILIVHKQELFNSLQIYTNHIESMYTEIRAFRHDHANIIATIYGYIQLDDMKGLEKYFSDQISPMTQNMLAFNSCIDKLKFVQNPQLKGILSIKLIYALELKYDVSIDISEKVNVIPVSMIDICRIAGILLDNALEECQMQEKPQIGFALYENSGQAIMVFENSITNSNISISELFKKGYSTKGENRGLGLNNLLKIVDENPQITLNTEVKSDKFIQIVHIYL